MPSNEYFFKRRKILFFYKNFSRHHEKNWQKKLVKSMSYDIDDGLLITDENDVSWTLQINAEIKIPEELSNKQNARTRDTTCIFCCKCDAAIKGYSEDIKLICSICEYINKL